MSVRGLLILGATGTIGRNTLDVVQQHPDRFRVQALTANQDVPAMLDLVRSVRPAQVAMADPSAARELAARITAEQLNTEVLAGPESITALAADSSTELVMSGVVGAAGLLPTLAAVRAGKQVLVANKEPLVMAGRLLMEAAKRHQAVLLPIDSEHNAIFQCLPMDYRCGATPKGVRRIILTASGGPFRDTAIEALAQVSPEQAVQHPNWVMGQKISVDSATMMNKGLELIEAHWLFGLPEDQIEVVVHPQSAIHSIVEYEDGSMLAQMGQSDMRVPIAHALGWPDRIGCGLGGLNLPELARMDFREPDAERYPCLGLARQALRQGEAWCNVLNAANEVAVQAFLDRQLSYTEIPEVLDACLHAVGDDQSCLVGELDAVLSLDRWARTRAAEEIAERAHA